MFGWVFADTPHRALCACLSDGCRRGTDAPTFSDEVNQISTHTLLVYLTATEDGSGATEFVRRKMTPSDHDDDAKLHERIAVTPTVGMGVVFAHGILHCARESFGTKHILVTRVYTMAAVC